MDTNHHSSDVRTPESDVRTPEVVNAAFFDLVHQVVSHVEQDNLERRVNERHDFAYVQLLAPYDGENLPSQADFRRVVCQDISQSGFAFLTRKQLESNFVVIALGPVPFKFYTAEIMHTQPIHFRGTVEYQVGCRLLERI